MSHPSASQATRRPLSPGELRTRVVAGVVLAVAALLAAYLGGLPAIVVAECVCVAVAYEWLQVTHRAQLALYPAIFFAFVLLAVASAGFGWLEWSVALAVGGGLALAVASRDAWLGAGVPYAAALGVAVLALRGDASFGWPALVFLFATIWATDSAAYFAGSLIGGPKLWPVISPKKTWSGAAGGLIGAVLAGGGAVLLLGLPLTAGLVVVAALLSLVGQAGDLLESAVKRRFGVKDAGRLIPGHGGVMDRVDGLSLAGLAAVLIGLLHAGPEQIGRGLLLW